MTLLYLFLFVIALFMLSVYTIDRISARLIFSSKLIKFN